MFLISLGDIIYKKQNKKNPLFVFKAHMFRYIKPLISLFHWPKMSLNEVQQLLCPCLCQTLLYSNKIDLFKHFRTWNHMMPSNEIRLFGFSMLHWNKVKAMSARNVPHLVSEAFYWDVFMSVTLNDMFCVRMCLRFSCQTYQLSLTVTHSDGVGALWLSPRKKESNYPRLQTHGETDSTLEFIQVNLLNSGWTLLDSYVLQGFSLSWMNSLSYRVRANSLIKTNQHVHWLPSQIVSFSRHVINMLKNPQRWCRTTIDLMKMQQNNVKLSSYYTANNLYLRTF